MKAALAIALSHETKLLILDEATAGMDVSGREEVLEILEDYVSKGHGILLSSHISEDMEQLATTLIFMRDGHILLQEDKHILLTDYGIIETDETSFRLTSRGNHCFTNTSWSTSNVSQATSTLCTSTPASKY